MRLVVMTPIARVLDTDEVIKVRLCLDDGSWLSLYERHAPIIAAVSACDLQYEDMAGVCTQFAIGAGIMQFKDETLSIFVNETLGQSTVSGDDDTEVRLESIDRLTGQLLDLLDQ